MNSLQVQELHIITIQLEGGLLTLLSWQFLGLDPKDLNSELSQRAKTTTCAQNSLLSLSVNEMMAKFTGKSSFNTVCIALINSTTVLNLFLSHLLNLVPHFELELECMFPSLSLLFHLEVTQVMVYFFLQFQVTSVIRVKVCAPKREKEAMDGVTK